MAYWVVAKCSAGHLFETPHVPVVSFKSIRLGAARLQRCPVGKHWAKVYVVPEQQLTDEQRREAHGYRTSSVP
jgi:hypothetical protein